VRIRLETQDAKFIVKVIQKASHEKVWETVPGPARHEYCVVGSWTNNLPQEMVQDPKIPTIWRYKATMGRNVSAEFRSFYELFHIQVDGDPNHALYPELPYSRSGESMVQGPDDQGKDTFFLVKGPHAGASFEIVLDLKATDRRKIVTWEWAQQPVYDFRGGILQLTAEADMPTTMDAETAKQ